MWGGGETGYSWFVCVALLYISCWSFLFVVFMENISRKEKLLFSLSNVNCMGWWMKMKSIRYIFLFQKPILQIRCIGIQGTISVWVEVLILQHLLYVWKNSLLMIKHEFLGSVWQSQYCSQTGLVFLPSGLGLHLLRRWRNLPSLLVMMSSLFLCIYRSERKWGTFCIECSFSF